MVCLGGLQVIQIQPDRFGSALVLLCFGAVILIGGTPATAWMLSAQGPGRVPFG
jgi:hypothetical protein